MLALAWVIWLAPLANAQAPVSLSWDPPASGPPAAYVVQWGVAPGVYGASLTVPSTTRTQALDGWQPGLRYYVSVVAVDASGARSLPSNELAVVPAGPAPGRPAPEIRDGLPREILSVVVDGPGQGTVVVRPGDTTCVDNCAVALPRSLSVILGATPAPGHRFTGWEGCDDGTAGTCLVHLDAARQVRARFEPEGAAGRTFTRYFAEGAVGDFFDARIVLANTGGRHTMARLRFLRDDGVTIAHEVAVPALATARVDAAGIAGLRGHAFSTVIESDVPLVADRTMAWKGRDGRPYGAHAETAIVAPAPRWYLAEGATHAGFDLFYLLQNPHDVSVRTRITYLRAAAPPLERVVVLPPRSRTSIWVDQEVFGPDARRLLESTELSAVVESLDGQGIVVERAMYDTRNGVTFEAGHESAGVTAPARRWYFAEGATGAFFDQFLLVANPNDGAVDLLVTYLLPDGSREERRHRVEGRSRYTIWVDQEGEALADTAVSTVVEASAPVVVERSMWWPGTSATWREAHNTAGATVSALRWAVGDGHGRNLAEGGATYLLVANPTTSPALVRLTVLFGGGLPPATRTVHVGPSSRAGFSVSDLFPEAQGLSCGTLIESVGPAPTPIIVERAMYADAPGQRWGSGTAVLATPLP